MIPKSVNYVPLRTYGQYLKRRRSATVEPVFGTLTQFLGLRKINTRGIQNANKVMLASAMAYNLKKYLKFTKKHAQTKVEQAHKALTFILAVMRGILSPNPRLIFS